MAKKKKPTMIVTLDPFRDIFIRLAEFIVDAESKKICIHQVDQVLYDNAVVNEFMSYDRPVSIGQLMQEINQFINRLLDTQQYKVVAWLLKTSPSSLSEENKKHRHVFDDEMLNHVKTALWLCAYCSLRLFNLPMLSSDIDENLCRLQGVFSTADDADDAGREKEKYLVNILSLKDTRYGFLPHPEHICPFDLAMILEDNGLHKQYTEIYHFTLSLQSAVYNAYERYHIFKFVRNIIHQLLQGNIKYEKD